MSSLKNELSDRIYIDNQNRYERRCIVVFDFRNAILKINKNDRDFVKNHIIKTILKAIVLSKDRQFVLNVLAHNIKKNRLTPPFVLALARICKKTFDDKMYKCFIRKPSKLFRVVYSILAILVDPETKEKIVILNN